MVRHVAVDAVVQTAALPPPLARRRMGVGLGCAGGGVLRGIAAQVDGVISILWRYSRIKGRYGGRARRRLDTRAPTAPAHPPADAMVQPHEPEFEQALAELERRRVVRELHAREQGVDVGRDDKAAVHLPEDAEPFVGTVDVDGVL